MKWLEKAPFTNDEFVVAMWHNVVVNPEPPAPAGRLRFNPVVKSTLRSFLGEAVTDKPNGRLVLFHGRVAKINNGIYRDADNILRIDSRAVTSIAANIYDSPDHEFGFSTWNYTVDDIRWGVENVLRMRQLLVNEDVVQFALKYMYPVLVRDDDYDKLLKDLAVATGNQQVLEQRLGGVVTLGTALAEAQRLGIQVISVPQKHNRPVTIGDENTGDVEALRLAFQDALLNPVVDPDREDPAGEEEFQRAAIRVAEAQLADLRMDRVVWHNDDNVPVPGGVRAVEIDQVFPPAAPQRVGENVNNPNNPDW